MITTIISQLAEFDQAARRSGVRDPVTIRRALERLWFALHLTKAWVSAEPDSLLQSSDASEVEAAWNAAAVWSYLVSPDLADLCARNAIYWSGSHPGQNPEMLPELVKALEQVRLLILKYEGPEGKE